jgi:DivIVA domain-containing protein
VAGDQKRREVGGEGEAAPRSRGPAEEVGSQQQAEQTGPEIRDVSFPVAVRGYERHAVDAYVQRVQRVIAQLEAGSSPRAAVKHAVDMVGEEIGGVLQHARQAAEEITAEALAEAEATTADARTEAEQIREDVELQAREVRGRSKHQADETLARAREQATELVRLAQEQARAVQEEAEPRLRELEADTEAVWDARRKLLEDLPRMATELMEIAGAASARLRRPTGASAPQTRSDQPQPEEDPADAPGAGARSAAWPAEPGRARAPAQRT